MKEVHVASLAYTAKYEVKHSEKPVEFSTLYAACMTCLTSNWNLCVRYVEWFDGAA